MDRNRLNETDSQYSMCMNTSSLQMDDFFKLVLRKLGEHSKWPLKHISPRSLCIHHISACVLQTNCPASMLHPSALHLLLLLLLCYAVEKQSSAMDMQRGWGRKKGEESTSPRSVSASSLFPSLHVFVQQAAHHSPSAAVFAYFSQSMQGACFFFRGSCTSKDLFSCESWI